MRLDHSEQIVSFTGEPIDDADGKPLTFRTLAITALNSAGPGEQLGAEKMARCYALSTKFFRGHKVNLTVDEAALIKERAGVILTPMSFGRLSAWLEGEPQFVATDEEADE